MADELQILIDCMVKAAGTRMPDEIKTGILSRARGIMDEQGLKPIAASRAALGEYLSAVQQDIANVEQVINPRPPPTPSEVKAEQGDNLEKFLGAVEREREKEMTELRAVASPQAVQAAQQTQAIAGQVRNFVSSLPEASDFKLALLRWTGSEVQSAFAVLQFNKEIMKNARSPVGREGITNYIQAGGDRVLLGQRAQASKNKNLKNGYLAAANLTPEEQKVAAQVIKRFADLRTKAIHYGIDIKEVENYVNQLWYEPGLKGYWTPRKLSEYFRFARHRTFESYFDGEQKGMTPRDKDIAPLVGIYENELNHAINSRIFVQEMSKGKASDGNPLLAPGGTVEMTADPGGPVPMSREASMAAGKGVYLILPRTMPSAAALKDLGYKHLDQPALKKWVWKGADPQGNPIMMQTDLLVHPEIYHHLQNVLGTSGIRNWWNSPSNNPFTQLGKGLTKFLLDEVQPTMKGTMFSMFSPFHQVQEGTHAIGHRIIPFNVPEIRLAGPNADPKQIDAVNHGLMLGPDRISQEQFMEGIASKNKNLATMVLRKFGGKAGAKLSDLQDWYTEYLFHDYIPGLKYKTFEQIFRRNTERFEKDLAAGKVDIAQVKMLSADQANAAYGHLNYAGIGRNPTLQHIWQIIGLAPDFFWARALFVGQAMKSIPGVSKDPRVGLEQLHAILLLAGLNFAIAQILNLLINGKIDLENAIKHPFDVYAPGLGGGTRRYSLRSVPADALHLGEDLYDWWTGREHGIGFVQNRLSPLVGKGVGQLLFGVNYRQEPVTLSESVADMAAGTIPLSLQGLVRGVTGGLTETSRANPISWLEQTLGAGGVVIHRVSALSEIYPMAREWVKENDPKNYNDTVFPVSKYQQLRFALEDSDQVQTVTEFQTLQNSGMTKDQIAKGFREAMKKPFTSSLANDKKFYLSLDVYDRAKFDAALERRAVILNRFDQWLPVGSKPVTKEILLNRILSRGQ